ncbi:hypothetical protein QWT36_23550, partial [Salmonella enterica subsp. enterica serovar Typhi]|nr:hypothetical protein [Salmonella enterica subsp. enterica serovar Typhi]
NGLTLAPGARIVVARDPAVFQAIYGTGINLSPLGYDPANLSNGGERVRLLGPAGETIQDFTYDDVSPWPTAPERTNARARRKNRRRTRSGGVPGDLRNGNQSLAA